MQKTKNLTNIFLNKNWVITETPNAIEIMAPDQYFNKTSDANIGIWFPKSVVFNSIKYHNQMVIGIDFTKEYEIKTSYQNSTEVKTKTILGEDLYNQLKQAVNKIKEKYFTPKKSISSIKE